MKYGKAACSFAGVMIFGIVGAVAQPSYYDSRARQNAEYKNLSNATNRAYTIPDRPSTSSPSRSPSSNTNPGSSTRSSSSNSTAGTGNTAPGYTPATSPKKTNAEIQEEHNAWLRKVQEEEKKEKSAQTSQFVREYEQADKRKAAYENESIRAPKVKALAADIEAKGFTPTEAFAMAYRIVPPVNGAVAAGIPEMRRMEEAQRALTRFGERRSAGSYGELAVLARSFEIATITALNAQQLLAARFPEKARETEMAELLAMPYIWGGTKTAVTLMQGERATEGEKREAIDRYRELSAKYPEEAKAVLATYNPQAIARLNEALAASAHK
jgi:type II secretory pathway pseudopilin PulG